VLPLCSCFLCEDERGPCLRYDLLFRFFFLAFPSGIADFDSIVLLPPFVERESFWMAIPLWSLHQEIFRSFIYLNSLPEMYLFADFVGGDTIFVSPGAFMLQKGLLHLEELSMNFYRHFEPVIEFFQLQELVSSIAQDLV